MGPELLYDEETPGFVLQRVEIRPGIIISPTCDFRRPTIEELNQNPGLEPYGLQPHVVVAQVIPLREVAEKWGNGRESKLGLMFAYDAIRRYAYLPSVDGNAENDMVVDLLRTDSIAIPLLVDLRIIQLTFSAAQHLQYKIVLAATSTYTDRSAYNPPLT